MGGLGFPFDIGPVRTTRPVAAHHGRRVAVILLLCVAVHRSPYGRLLIAVGGNEPLGGSLGKSTFRTKRGCSPR